MPLFEETFEQAVSETPAVKERFKDFLAAKKQRPPQKFSNDHKLHPPFDGMSECHLAGDACLIYSDNNDVVTLLAVCKHDDLKGKRAKSLAKKIKQQT